MAFLNNLITAITADTSVNIWATGGFKYHELPVNADNTKNWFVFDYSEDDEIKTFGGTRIPNYSLEIQLISPSVDLIKNIFPILNDHLTNYMTNDLEFILISGGLEDFNSEKAVYYKTIRYSIL